MSSDTNGKYKITTKSFANSWCIELKMFLCLAASLTRWDVMHHVVLGKKKNSNNNNRKETNFVHCIRCISMYIKSSTVLNLLFFEPLHNSLNRNDLFFSSFSPFKCTYPASYALQPCRYDLWVCFVCFFLSEFTNPNASMSFEVSNTSLEYGIVVCECVWHSNFQLSRWKIRFF